MTMLDDQVDDLLRHFRADEAVIDDPLRQRMWDEVARTTATAPVPLRPAAGRPSGRRVLAAAALVLAALAGGVVARATAGDGDPGDRATEQARADGTAGAPTLTELADQLSTLGGPVLGDPGATYAHVVASSVHHAADGSGDSDLAGRAETWVSLDGTGRRRGMLTNGANPEDVVVDQVGMLPLGALRAAAVVVLPDDADATIAAAIADLGSGDDPAVVIADPLIEALAHPGIPGPARAGALRALDRLGFETAPGIDAGTVTLAGPAHDDAVVTAVLDVATGRITSRQLVEVDGSTTATWWSDADLRPTTD